MLFYIVLFFAATLASGIKEPVPKWSQVYSFRMDFYRPTEEYHSSLKVWYDGVLKKTRVDEVDGYLTTRQMYVEPNVTDLNNSSFILIEPMTTEEHLNMRVCTLYRVKVHDDDSYYLPPIDEDRYSYLGKERMHGEDASHWQSLHQKNDIVQEFNIWVTLKQGVHIPLKFESKLHDTKHGILLDHTYIDVFDFDTSEINPKIWDISKGLDCKNPYVSIVESHLANNAMNFLRPFQNLKEHDNIHSKFAQFKIKFNKNYESEDEHNKRLKIFEENVRFINDHNKAGHSYKLGINHLADLTEEELAMMRGIRPQSAPSKALPFPYTVGEMDRLSQGLPKEFDWRPYGAVTPIKNQGSCGSCWAFSVVGAVEGALFLHNGRDQVVRLSEQALVDCSWGFGNYGCGGGYPDHAFEWMKKHGLPTDDAYGGYIQSNGMCLINNVTKAVSVKAYYQVPEGDEKALQVALFKHGPVAVAIDAMSRKFVFYLHGVFYNPDCYSETAALNHAVLVVGYGILDGEKYWIVKNSWGPNWGNSGYVLMSTKDNNCGVETLALYAEIE